MVIVSILFLLIELPMFYYLLIKIKRNKQISLKDTIIYPCLLVISTLIVFIGRLKYDTYEHWYNLIPMSLSSSVSLIALNVDNNFVELLKQKDLFLLINYFMIYGISALALFSIAFLLFKAFINNSFRIKIFNKEINYIVNLSDDAKLFIKNLSPNERKNIVVILNEKDNYSFTEEKLFLDEFKVKFIILPIISKYNLVKNYNKSLKRLTKFINKKEYRLVSFFENDEEVYNFINCSKNYLKENNLYESNLKFIIVTNSEKIYFVKELIKGNNIKLNLKSNNENIVVLDESRGAIRAVDKYEIMAQDFIWKNPLSKYFPRNLLNENGTTKDCIINMFVLGFGKVNQTLLKNVLIQSQFVKHNKCLEINPINVYVFDNNKKLVSYDLMTGLLKYNKSKFNEKKYFDLPRDYISNVHFMPENDVKEQNFINTIYDKINSESEKSNIVNYFIISLGNDYLNSTIAQNLQKTLSVLPNIYNTYFVRSKSAIELDLKEDINNFNINSNKIIYFGNEKKVFTYNNIISVGLYKAARQEGLIYKNREELTNNKIDETATLKNWATLSKIKQIQNVHAILSIPFKLGLLGMTVKDFDINIYKNKYIIPKDGHDCATYIGEENPSFSARDVMAFIEHERWNATALSEGIMPMKIEKSIYVDKNGITKFTNKSPEEMYHLCLTSQKGLNQYYEYVNDVIKKYYNDEKDNKPTADVIQYDFDLMDRVEEHITNMLDVGY